MVVDAENDYLTREPEQDTCINDVNTFINDVIVLTSWRAATTFLLVALSVLIASNLVYTDLPYFTYRSLLCGRVSAGWTQRATAATQRAQEPEPLGNHRQRVNDLDERRKQAEANVHFLQQEAHELGERRDLKEWLMC